MPQPTPCPSCTAPMSPEPFGSIHVDVCGACHGLWFDGGELARLDHHKKGAGPALRAALAVEPAEVPEDRVLACPRCARTMDVEHHELEAEIELDVCAGCEGVFLDAGELARLRRRKLTSRERTAIRHRKRRSKKRAELEKSRQRRAVMVGMMVMAG